MTHESDCQCPDCKPHEENCHCEDCKPHDDDCDCEDCKPHDDDCDCKDCEPHDDDCDCGDCNSHEEDCDCEDCKPHDDDCDCGDCKPHDDDCDCGDCKPKVEMSLRNEVADGVLTVFLEGRIDAVGSATYGEELLTTLNSFDAVILDLGGVDYVSSAGLRIFLQMAKTASTGSKTVRLANVQPMVGRVFEMSGMQRLFDLG